MKNLKNKKGFTIVELVIVIAVIAILAAVLIPTFGGVIEKANASKDMQAARNLYTEFLAEADETELSQLENVKYVFYGYKFYEIADFDKAPVADVADTDLCIGEYTEIVEEEEVTTVGIQAGSEFEALIPNE